MSTTAQIATIRHGYTMADLDRFARFAAAAFKRHTPENYDVAWGAIAEFLYSSETSPRASELVMTGREAIWADMREDQHHHGQWRDDDAIPAQFAKYWVPQSDDFTERIAERLALPQVLGVLTPLQYDAVVALANHGNQTRAAASLGLSVRGLQKRIGQARAAIAEAWLGGETPTRNTPRSEQDERCRYGHLRADYSHRDSQGVWVCRVCKRNRTRRLRARKESVRVA